jgi:hypothetical protein
VFGRIADTMVDAFVARALALPSTPEERLGPPT